MNNPRVVHPRMRDAFAAIVNEDDGRCAELLRDVFDDDPPAKGVVIWAMVDYHDAMPDELCVRLEVPPGTPYVFGAGALIRQRPGLVT